MRDIDYIGFPNINLVSYMSYIDKRRLVDQIKCQPCEGKKTKHDTVDRTLRAYIHTRNII